MSRLDSVTEALRANGTIAADAAPLDVEDSGRPWFVSLLLGAAGWLAGLLLILFIGITFKVSEGVGLAILGVFLLAGAWGLYRADVGGAFLGQLALAFSMAGQVAVAAGLMDDVNSAFAIGLVLLILQLIVFAVMPNRTARTIAALFAGLAWVYTVRSAIYPDSIWGGLLEPARDEARFGAVSTLLAWTITWVPLLAAVRWLLKREAQWMAQSLRDWLRPALTGLLIVTALGGLATEPLVTAMFGPEEWGMNIGWWGLFPLLSIGLALFAAWCAFRLRNAGLMGLGLFGALLHLSRFYYLYGTTLLVKSLIMLVVGVLLLAAAWLLRKSGRES